MRSSPSALSPSRSVSYTHLLIRQLRLISGVVYLDGSAMEAMTEREIARRMSVLMTERVQPELMTCGDVVATGRYPYTGRMGILSAEDRKKVREALSLVHAQELDVYKRQAVHRICRGGGGDGSGNHLLLRGGQFG